MGSASTTTYDGLTIITDPINVLLSNGKATLLNPVRLLFEKIRLNYLEISLISSRLQIVSIGLHPYARK